MKILRPIKDGKFTETNDLRNSIFLAGPCPREKDDFKNDWRNQAFEILKDIGFTGTVITPTNQDYQDYRKHDHNALTVQTKWEYETMKKCSALVFWIDRSDKHPAMTTNIEIGDWYDREGVYVGWPKDAPKNDYIEIRLKMRKEKRIYNDLREMLKQVVDDLNRPAQMFFTSDTHFGQEATRKHSRRPFVDAHDMDLGLISNWNKRVTMNDTVVHAGDFGDIKQLKEVLGNLNFGKLIWVMGNYDRVDALFIRQIIKETKRDIELRDDYSFTHTTDKGKKVTFYVVHEPKTFDTIKSGHEPTYPSEFVLFGHIHGRGAAKMNGFDVGTDYHRYTPISMEDVLWYHNACQYWDDNVYCDKAIV